MRPGACIRIQIQIDRAGTFFAGSYLGFLHGSHQDLEGSLADLGLLLKRRPRRSKTYVLGDFNVDLLPLRLLGLFCRSGESVSPPYR